ncbi:MAG: hypothetical protein LBH86_06530 [Oscillospiraceae bacterium]|jgi:nitrogen regulatory protein PII|nr:hypothetical protein [Oscillospiraceae bacterium]
MVSHDKRQGVKLLAVVVDRDREKHVTELFRKMHIHTGTAILARGSANSEILDFLGLGSADKTMLMSLAPAAKVNFALHTLFEKLKLSHPGKGIAFTLPLSGIGEALNHVLEEEVRELMCGEVEQEMEKEHGEIKHSLVIAVVNEGFSEDVMEAAREAGATGGTVVLARRVALDEEAVTIFGVEVDVEKEVVIILAAKETKRSIMQAISRKCGLRTEARGAVFSLPVDTVIGLNLTEPDGE